MTKVGRFDVMDNFEIARDVYCMTLLGDTSEIVRPGQFVNVAIPGFYLRRPFSVCSVRGEVLTLVYKVVGAGTAALAMSGEGGSLELLTGLGNGFDVSKGSGRPLLVGGGMGSVPLYGLAEALLAEGREVHAIFGFKSAEDMFLVGELTRLGAIVYAATEDGSAGVHGFVTDAMAEAEFEYDYIYACGPEPMLRALYDYGDLPGQYSFEERMGCGFGACMGCTCETITGHKRICKEGPVLDRSEIKW